MKVEILPPSVACKFVSCHHSFAFCFVLFFCFLIQAHLQRKVSAYIPLLVFTFVVAFFVPALLPGFKLRHDRVFCTYDLERLDRPHGQREPDRGGAEVGPSGCPPPAWGPSESQCDNQDSVFQLDRLLRVSFIDICFENISLFLAFVDKYFSDRHLTAFMMLMLILQSNTFAVAFSHSNPREMTI